MELSKKDRLILFNQYKILEALYPEEADFYALNREIVESGYKIHYSDISQNISNEMNIEDSKEVLNILDMYRALYFSVEEYKKGVDKKYKGIEIKFPGFDGNSEAEQLVYAKFYLHKMQRFEELHHSGEYPDYNSHSYTLSQYRKMLEKWKSFGENVYRLNETQIDQLLEIAVLGTKVEKENDKN